MERSDVKENYLNYLSEQLILVKPLKVIIDASNGTADAFALEVFIGVGAETAVEWKEKGRSIEEIDICVQRLKKISDHYPVIADIF